MQLSPYAQIGARLIDNGYSAIPIMPGTKRPGVYQFKGWFGTSEWQRFCDRRPSEFEYPLWEKWPDAGVCVAIDHQLKVIDIDTDDSELMSVVLSILPDSPVKKRGQKGFSAFYRGSKAIISCPFSIRLNQNDTKGTRIVDLLAHGRQTVCPPTIHPDSHNPYEWLTSETLVDTSIDQLPELPDNIADLIATALEPFGYFAPPQHHSVSHGDGDTMWREINDLAMANLDSWVPALRLPGTKRSGNGSYRAVAEWRGVENSNLAFHSNGIKDWGEDKSYTPIDIVMAATRADFYTATKWLCTQIGYEPTQIGDDFDVAAFIARDQAKKKPTKPVDVPLKAPLCNVDIAENVTDSEHSVLSPNTDILQPVAAPRAKVNPFDFSYQGGLMGRMSGWIYDTARAPVAEFSTIASVAFLSAFYGRRYVTPTGAGLNMYLIGIAGPGFGKDHPRKAIEALGYDAQFNWLIGPNEVTSDSAIEKIVRKRPCFVMPWDEVGVMLQGVSGKQSQSWTRSIRKALLELYSRSTGVWTGKEHADSKTDSSGDPVFCPTVSVLGMSTPTEFYAGITEQNLQDGMMARMTVISASNRPPRHDTAPILTVPADLIRDMKLAYAAAPKAGNLAGAADRDPKRKPILHPAKWGEGARERWKDIEVWQLDLMDEKPEQEGIVGRAAEQTIKIATIRAISMAPADPIVTVDDVEFGWALVQLSIDMIDEGVRKYMASSDFESLHKRLLEVISEAGSDGIPKSALMRKRGVSKVQPREMEAAIKWLQDAGLVKVEIGVKEKGGRPGVRYRLP